MHDEQKQMSFNHACRVPARFIADDPVKIPDKVRIVEGEPGRLKADAVLADIGLRLGAVPTEVLHVRMLPRNRASLKVKAGKLGGLAELEHGKGVVHPGHPVKTKVVRVGCRPVQQRASRCSPPFRRVVKPV